MRLLMNNVLTLPGASPLAFTAKTAFFSFARGGGDRSKHLVEHVVVDTAHELIKRRVVGCQFKVLS